MFGTREYLKNNYLYRMAAAVLGIYGNSKQEAMYPMYHVDADGQKLDGANRYTLRFAPGQLPPVNAFWSLTMYELPSSLLVANPLNRYLINSPMLPQFKKDADGGLTLLIQNESPGADKEANWLPAPKGPFWMAMRLYWPKAEAIEGKWKQPPVVRNCAGRCWKICAWIPSSARMTNPSATLTGSGRACSCWRPQPPMSGSGCPASANSRRA